MKGRKLLFTLGICVATSVAVVTPAFAWDQDMYTDDPSPGGRVRFEATGDIVEVCDIEADGFGVYLEVHDNTSGITKYSLRISGNNECQTVRASMGGSYNLAENHVFRFKICLVRGSESPRYCDTQYWANVN